MHFIFYLRFGQTLANALSKRDIDAFRRALNSPSDVEKLPTDKTETQISIFEQACQTPGCAEFIEECVSIGCDVNKVILFKRNILCSQI